MPYNNIVAHVTESYNLYAELAEIMLYGKTMGTKSPDPFILNPVQQWGLRHFLECPTCTVNIKEFVEELAKMEKIKLSKPPFHSEYVSLTSTLSKK